MRGKVEGNPLPTNLSIGTRQSRRTGEPLESHIPSDQVREDFARLRRVVFGRRAGTEGRNRHRRDLPKVLDDITQAQAAYQDGPFTDLIELDKPEVRYVTSLGELSACHVASIGGMLAVSDAITKGKQTLRKVLDPSQMIEPLVDLTGFDSPQGADLRIGTISLADISSQQKGQLLNLPAIFSYGVESFLMITKKKPEDYFSDNNHFPANEYPYATAVKLIEVATGFTHVLNFLGQEKYPELRNVKTKYPDFVKRGIALIKTMDQFYERFYETLLNPEADGFSELAEMINTYFDENQDQPFYVSFMIAPDPKNFQRVYREAKKLEGHERYGSFFARLGERMADYAETLREYSGINQSYDAEVIFSQTDDSIRDDVSFEAIKQKVSNIFSSISTREYDVNPDAEQIQWGGFLKPKTIKVKFNSGNEAEFSVTLHYENDEESMDVKLEFDVRKGQIGKFDWNFIESSDDDSMQQFAGALRHITASILDNVGVQAKQKQQEKITLLTRPVSVPVQRIKEEKVRPALEEEVTSRKRPTQGSDRIEGEEEVVESTQAPELSEVTKQIVIPENLRELLPPGINLRFMTKKLERFNAFGEGENKFKQMKTDRGDPINKFSFRVRAIRFILVEEPSDEERVRKFRIQEVGNRRDVYRGY